MIIIAHNIRSLHNVGAIFRNAAAFGIERLYLTGITGLPPRKEIAKTALGAEDLVPWQTGDIAEIIRELKAGGVEVYGLEQDDSAVMLDEFADKFSAGFAPSSSPMSGGETIEMPRTRGSIDLRGIAKDLRKEATQAEILLWEKLRNKQLQGRKFRRQHGIGPFIVDFYCDSERLIIEVDGGIHKQTEVREHDEIRQDLLVEMGYRIIRITNELVLNDTDKALERIVSAFSRHPSSHGGAGGGEQSVAPKPRLALVLGNEVEGIDAETRALLDGFIEIPMQKKKSLNVSVASGIAMYLLTK